MIRSEQIALGYSTLKLSIYLTLVMTYLIWTGSSDLMVEFKWNGEHRTKSGLTVHDYCCSPPAAGFSAVGGTWPGPWAPWTTLDAGWKSQQRAQECLPRVSSAYQNLGVMQFAGTRWNFGIPGANRNFTTTSSMENPQEKQNTTEPNKGNISRLSGSTAFSFPLKFYLDTSR